MKTTGYCGKKDHLGGRLEMSEKQLKFRYAKRNDAALVLKFIRELAAYENMESEVTATTADLEEWVFDKKNAEVIFAVIDSEEIGFALFFHNFSTFLGRAGFISGGFVCQAPVQGEWLWKEHSEKIWLKLQLRGAADAWNGGAWIGTSQALTFIYHWVPRLWKTGPFTALPVRHWNNYLLNKELSI